MSKLDIQVLGPLQVFRGGKPVNLPPRSARLLVLLVVRRETGITDERLLEELWRQCPPPTAAQALRVRVHELRRLLGAPNRVERISGGYRLILEDDELDATRFTALAAAGSWREAEELWRGPAYTAHTDSALVHEAAVQLDELRIEVMERRIQADLMAGRTDMVPELRALVQRYPLREELWEQLMLALYRAGRQSEALQAYQRARRILAKEVGLDPGPSLRAMEQRILAGDPTLTAGRPGPASAMPRAKAAAELPRDMPLVGRESEIKHLVDALTADPGPAIVTISGPGGTGKSVLAVHVCHQVADRFPDGRIYVDLRGSTPGASPRTAVEVLGSVLRSLDPASQPRGDEGEDAAQFRSVTHDRRVLILLDNAADARQVAPLIPSGAGCAVVVTARRPLTTLPAATHLPLAVLSDAASLDLLAQVAGPERVRAEPESARRLAALCGGLPLALRIAGGRLAAHPGRTLAEYASRLADTRHRLDELDHQDLSVRASITVGCQDLQRSPGGRDAVTLLAYLGLWDGTDISGPIAAALTGWNRSRSERALDVLTEAQLLHSAVGGRYSFHDLLRLYARERSIEELDEPTRTAAIGRLVRHYLDTAQRVAQLLGAPADSVNAGPRADAAPEAAHADSPGFENAVAALTWIRTERANLLTAARHAAANLPEAAVGLAAVLSLPFKMHGWYRELATLGQLAVNVAQRHKNHGWLARGLLCLGTADVALGRLTQSIAHLKEAAAHWRATGGGANETATLVELARAYSVNGQDRLSLRCFEEALELSSSTGDLRSHVIALLYLAIHKLRSERYTEAQERLQHALTLLQEFNEPRALGSAYAIMGAVHLHWGDPRRALPLMRKGLSILQDSKDLYLQARAYWGLAQIHTQLDDRTACSYYRTSLDLLVELGLLDDQQAQTIMKEPTRIQTILPDFVVTGFPEI